jgi:hypothetical protein
MKTSDTILFSMKIVVCMYVCMYVHVCMYCESKWSTFTGNITVHFNCRVSTNKADSHTYLCRVNIMIAIFSNFGQYLAKKSSFS